VFLPVRDVLEQDWPEHDDEVRRLDLQYRKRLGVRHWPYLLGRLGGPGRGTAGDRGVDHMAAGRRDSADPGPVGAGALLSMDALSTVTPDVLRPVSSRWSGYGEWLDEQRSSPGAARST
jgi:hypothetical protein